MGLDLGLDHLHSHLEVQAIALVPAPVDTQAGNPVHQLLLELIQILVQAPSLQPLGIFLPLTAKHTLQGLILGLVLAYVAVAGTSEDEVPVPVLVLVLVLALALGFALAFVPFESAEAVRSHPIGASEEARMVRFEAVASNQAKDAKKHSPNQD